MKNSEEYSASVKEKARLRRRFFLRKGKKKFRRCESWRYVRVKERWRAPRGIDSKMRIKLKSRPPLPSIGHRIPRTVRGLHPSGFEEVLVHSIKELEKVNSKKQAVRIAHTVGKRKRIKILEEAGKKKIHVLNPPKVEAVGTKEPEEVSSKHS